MNMTDPNSRTYAVIGTGAVGGYYGGLLAKSGQRVHFLSRSDHAVIRQHGLRIDSRDGDYVIQPASVFASSEDMPKCDVILVCIKTTANANVRELIEPILKEDSLVVVLQNGLFVEEAASQVVGYDRVVGGCCFLCSTKVGPGHVHHIDYGRVVLGAYRGKGNDQGGGHAGQMQRVFRDFVDARIEASWSENLLADRWKKLMWNIPYNGLSVVLDASTSDVMGQPHSRQLVRDIMVEVQQIASASGIAIDDSLIEKLIRDTDAMVPYDSSMRVDYRMRRGMELEAIFEMPLEVARHWGHPAPRLTMLSQQLRFLDARNLATKKADE
jgi:2-dehydropantoate 2-reductase